MFLVQLPEDTFHMMGLKLFYYLYFGCSYDFCLLADLVLPWFFFHKCTKLMTVV